MSLAATAGSAPRAAYAALAPLPQAAPLPLAQLQQPLAPAAQAAPPPPPPEAGVPDIVVDRKTDSSGGVVLRTYQRGRLLGKVRCAAAGGLARRPLGAPVGPRQARCPPLPLLSPPLACCSCAHPLPQPRATPLPGPPGRLCAVLQVPQPREEPHSGGQGGGQGDAEQGARQVQGASSAACCCYRAPLPSSRAGAPPPACPSSPLSLPACPQLRHPHASSLPRSRSTAASATSTLWALSPSSRTL